MSNVVTLQGPNPTQEIISHFLDQYNANQRSRAEVGVQQQQLDQSASQHNDNFGLLQKQYEQKLAEYNDKQLNDDAVPVKARLASFSDAAQSTQDPNERAAIEAQAKAFFDGLDPRMQAKVKLDALAPVLTPQRQATLNTNKFSATQTGIAAGGGTDPNAVNFTTKAATGSFMPAEGFTQQQATDLANRAATTQSANTGTANPATGMVTPPAGATPTPNMAQKIPAPSGNAVSDYEARQTGAMPASPQNQTAQTQLTQTAMQEAGANTRQGMQAKSAMDLEKYKMSAAGADAGERDIKTTVSGQRYADLSQYSGPLKNQLIKHYRDMGVPVLDKSNADAIREVDNARLNQKLIADGLLSKLPKDPTGRVLGGALENKLSDFFQTDEYLASYPAFRTAAIQALRASAGSKGLRINQAEIAMAVDKDIPKITDTVATAMQKIKDVSSMLDSAEKATLGTFGTGATDQGGMSPGEAWAKKHLSAAPPQ